MTARMMVYVVSVTTGPGALPYGAFSSLDVAKAQAQRRNKLPLEWRELTTDDPQCKTIHQAKLTSWASDCCIVVWEMQIDRKHFR